MKNGDNYQGRGIYKSVFLKSLKKGKLKEMLEVINQDKELDVQIRKDYLNIYYQGGNIAKVNSENSIGFDEFYFYTDTKSKPKKEIEKDVKIVAELKAQKDQLTEIFKRGEYLNYFKKAKEVMDEWFSINTKPERLLQHLLSSNKKFGVSDYTIIDLEYQVSTKSDFACTFIPEGKSDAKQPRFDIIAIDKDGKLCVIELKKGVGSLKGESGLKEHWESYRSSIGQNPYPFVKEMRFLLEQKQDFNLTDRSLDVISDVPEFMFAYAYDDKNSIEEQNEEFEKEYSKIGKSINVIQLDGMSKKLSD